MESIVQDIRYALRTLGRSPGFALAAILTLGLGMGAGTAVFTLLKRVVLDPLPYPQASRLVRLKNQVPGVGPAEEWQLSTAQYFYFRAHAKSLGEIGIYQTGGVNVAVDGGPQRATVVTSTAGLLRLLGARATIGRLYDDSDDSPDAPSVVVLSNGFWQREFGGAREVVGKTLYLNERPFVILGVLAPGVDLPQERGSAALERSDVWFPMRLDPAGPFYNNHVYAGVARLAAGASAAGATAEIARLTMQLPEAFPQAYSAGFFRQFGFRTVVYPLQAYVLGDLSRNLWMLFGAVGFVLIIACANVANLLLVRVESRRREIAVRTALGAGRAAILRHAFAESLVIAGLAGVLALLISSAGVSALAALAPAGTPRLDHLELDGGVLAFTLALAVVVATGLAAVVTARYAPGGIAALGEGGRSSTAGLERQRLRSALVVTQVALALVLLVGAGLLTRSFHRLRTADPGIDPDGVVTVQLFLPRQRYDDMEKVWRFTAAALDRVRALPGVTSAGISQNLPFASDYGCTVQGFEDAAVRERLRQRHMTSCAGQAATTPGYLEALRIPLIAGRSFTPGDNDAPATGAVIVSKAFAQRFWPGEDAIGQGVTSARGTPPFYHVVGVVGDVHATSLGDPPAIAIYYPMAPNTPRWNWYLDQLFLVVRTRLASPASLLPSIRRAVAAVDPAIPLANAEEMRTIVDRSMSRLSFTMVLLGVAGATALLLAAIGLYGTISYIVARRTPEIGVRIALGAPGPAVQRLVVGASLRLTAAGLGAGMIVALMLTRLLRALLFGIGQTDLLSYAAASALLALVALAAAWVPARRATRLDPMIALRAE
jgi:putative ABC transport system permease protein